jgi:hypothetical protein
VAAGPTGDRAIKVKVDDSEIFATIDRSVSTGTIAQYSNFNAGSFYDNILVQDLTSGIGLLIEYFTDDRADGWVIVDEEAENGYWKWAVSKDARVQSSKFGSLDGTYALYASRGIPNDVWRGHENSNQNKIPFNAVRRFRDAYVRRPHPRPNNAVSLLRLTARRRQWLEHFVAF